MKRFFIDLGYGWIRLFRPCIRKVPPWLRYVWEKDVSQAISVWTFVIILLKLLTKNEILALSITMFLVPIILGIFRKLRRIIEKYDSLIFGGYSLEEARERLKEKPLKDLISPSVKERIEAIKRISEK